MAGTVGHIENITAFSSSITKKIYFLLVVPEIGASKRTFQLKKPISVY